MTNNVIGNTFYGSKGYMVVEGQYRYATFLGRKQEPGPAAAREPATTSPTSSPPCAAARSRT